MFATPYSCIIMISCHFIINLGIKNLVVNLSNFYLDYIWKHLKLKK